MGLILINSIIMTNKKLLGLLGLALLIGFSACKDDDIVKGSPADEGDEVNFGAQLNDPKSRTYYGPESNGAFPIYWNTEAQGFDKIFVYAPKAMAGRNQAYFTVRPNSGEQTTPAAVVKVGDAGIQWGNQPTEFYGFYPGNDNFNIKSSGETTITATLPGDQTADIAQPFDADPTTGLVFEAKPDMSCCMMVAKTDATNPTTEPVSLQFTPLSTVIDVTINGPKLGNTTNPYRVTSVSLISEAHQICGEFTYDYATGKISATSEDEADRMITISTMGTDKEGNYVGVPLHTNQTLHVQIFMLPNVDAKDLSVRVTTADSKVWTKKLDTTNLGIGEINRAKLPELIADEAKLDYSRWLSQLDPRIYISELSLPGSALSFNINGYVQNENAATITQWGDLTQQFNNGVRVFQGHVWLKDGAGMDGGDSQFYISTSNGFDTGLTLKQAVDRLLEEMKSSHTHGFCVLMLSDYTPNANETVGHNYTIDDVYDRFKVITQYLQNDEKILPEGDITPTTTIADVRGKIILKWQFNATSTLKSDNGGDFLNGPANTNSTLTNLSTCWEGLAITGTSQTKALFNWWAEAAGSSVFYAPMTFGRIGRFTFTGASGTALNYTRAVITEQSPGLAVEAARILVQNASATNKGNYSCASKPTDMSTGLWYIFTEQANPGRVTTGINGVNLYTPAFNNIGNTINAIVDTYTGTQYNKFYMTYVGGAGSNASASSYSTEQVKNNFNYEWYTKVNAAITTADEQKKNFPLGWVLFNDITDNYNTGTNVTIGEKTRPLTTLDCITKVIEHNTKEGFMLARDKTKPITPAAAPRGDVKGVSNGGYLFR